MLNYFLAQIWNYWFFFITQVMFNKIAREVTRSMKKPCWRHWISKNWLLLIFVKIWVKWMKWTVLKWPIIKDRGWKVLFHQIYHKQPATYKQVCFITIYLVMLKYPYNQINGMYYYYYCVHCFHSDFFTSTIFPPDVRCFLLLTIIWYAIITLNVNELRYLWKYF